MANARSSATTDAPSSIIRTGYVLMVTQLILGVFVVGLFWYNINEYKVLSDMTPIRLIFLVTPGTFIIGNFCFLCASFITIKSGGIIFRTSLDLIYHTVAFIAYLAASIAFFVEILTTLWPSNSVYNCYLTSSVIGIVVSGLYFISAFLTFKFYRHV
ncbi:uncharacterized protein LOC129808111 [Phlebotomus papatasi]|uniref:uncharacterized protein LOC129808111 n=1 Tax=Phlebotomus papatasi TaxID=29031 RepID=UPI0024833811|nr:uncharacterized protein LOC129808111 [Phlebotomus papatasi]